VTGAGLRPARKYLLSRTRACWRWRIRCSRLRWSRCL